MLDFINKNKNQNKLAISQNVFCGIINDLKDEIIENKKTFIELYKLDMEKSDFSINFDTIINLLEQYKFDNIEQKNKEICLASYYGNVYITVNLCMQSLTRKRATIAIIEDKMYAVNKFIVEVFNNVLRNYKIDRTIEIYNNTSLEVIKEIQNDVDYIICIGNSNTYYKFAKNGIENLKYIPFKNFALFCEDKYFEDLKYEIYKFALNNFIEAEIYNDLDEFIECTNIDKNLENIVVFTRNKVEIDKCKERIKKYNLFINENPFKNETFKVLF